MKKSQKITLGIIAFLVLLSLYGLYPSLVFHSMSNDQKEALLNSNSQDYYSLKNRALRLGLDLKGGMHIVLQVEKPEGRQVADVQERALEIIRNRIDKIGVTEPLIQKSGENRIVVDLPGFTDIEQAKKLIGETALLQFKLPLTAEESQALLAKIDSVLAKTKPQVGATAAATDSLKLAAAKDTAAQSIANMFNQNDTAKKGAEEALESENAKPLTSLINESNGIMFAVSMEDYYEAKSLIETPEVMAIIPPEVQLVWSTRPFYRGERQYQGLYVLRNRVELSGEHLIDAQPSFDQFRRPIVSFSLDKAGARKFAALTSANINKPLAIVLDDRVESAPEIKATIRESGQIELGGSGATWDDAKLLSIVLKAGALPAKVQIIQNSIIGPSLGQDSINKGKLAAIVGLLSVMVFMFFYYRVSGLIADFGLILNFIWLLGFMVIPGINATLTMPGIAGIILTMGMSVDSNVLIFERIREELRTGKTIRASIDAGYARALLTVIDSHVTTLITALFLFIFGTGPIKGFAVTLSVGVSLSLFTAFFITKAIFDIRKQYKTLSI
jgi:protein-export membrane protein SecD